MHSGCYTDENGVEHQVYGFDDLLPHHARFVRRCFLGFHHFYDTRSDNGLKEWARGYNGQASLPHYETCMRLLEVFEELQDEMVMKLIEGHIRVYGLPCCGSACDIWSLKSCKQSFACFRGAFVLNGDLLAALLGNCPELRGQFVDMSPILGFDIFEETRHTGAAIARWKISVGERWKMARAVGLTTEDGASNNKLANKLLGLPQKVCVPHDVARAVLTAAGETGTPCQNTGFKQFTKAVSKQSAAFNRRMAPPAGRLRRAPHT